MCLRAILVISGTLLVQNIQQEILYLLFGVCYMSAGGHFGKWPPRPPGNSWQWLHPQNCSVPKLVLLSKNAQ